MADYLVCMYLADRLADDSGERKEKLNTPGSEATEVSSHGPVDNVNCLREKREGGAKERQK